MGKFADKIQGMQDDHDEQNAAILSALLGLNYWGKKIDKSRAAVVSLVCEELETDETTVKAVIDAENLRKAKEPPKKKVIKVDNRPVSAGNLSKSEQNRPTVAGRKFLVTSAQNNTEVHADFLAALEAYAAHIGAEILVYPFIYNLNGFQNGEGNDEIWYADALKPYMMHGDVWLGVPGKVAAMGWNILPTVKNPLAGMKEALGAAQAMIVPHATIAHENVAVLGAQFGATVPGLFSTGAVTMRNYIQQQAGQKAEHRHNFGALIVEFDSNDQFWIRQIETNESGEFQDLRNYVAWDDEWVVIDRNIEVLNYGDIHAEKLDQELAGLLWRPTNSDTMLDYLKPRYQMMHDILDFSSLNHHNRENPHHNIRVALEHGTVEKDLIMVADVLGEVERQWCWTVVVRSNHDDALDRWLVDMKYDPRKDPTNAKIYYQLQLLAIDAYENDKPFDALPLAMCMDGIVHTTGAAKFLRASESFKVGGIELGEHGHSGTNGSRGSPKQFAAMKCTTGHTHTPSIYGGCYTAGVTGKLAMGYNETGASNWQQACVVQYPTGFRAIVHVKRSQGVLRFRAD